MTANETQVGGSHYGPGAGSFQHWDFVNEARLDWCGANATKYVARWWQKNGAVDLQKAIHYLQKRQEQGIACRLGFYLPYETGTAMAAKQRWMDEGAAVPEYEQGIITQIVLGSNEEAIALIQKLLDNADAVTS